MLEKTNGIVLHTLKYSENSLVLIVYTEEYGRQSYMLTGVHSKKAGGPKKLIQVLNLLALEVYFKSSRELQKIKEYKAINHLTGIYSSIVKTTIGLFIAEILYRTIREEEKNPGLYGFIANSIQYLDLADKGVENFHLVFLIQLSKFLGFYPEDNFDSLHNSFNLKIGSFQAFTENDRNLVNKQESFIIQKILKMTYSDIAELELSGNLRTAVLDKLILYFQMHSEGVGQLNSHRVLQEVFSTNSNNETH
jgi:DNA repair protein RecO (recombination protein O)